MINNEYGAQGGLLMWLILMIFYIPWLHAVLLSLAGFLHRWVLLAIALPFWTGLLMCLQGAVKMSVILL